MKLTEKIIAAHLVKGEMIPGKPIEIAIDQTLTQDATGTMAYLQLEALGIERVKTEVSVSYVDHNTLQSGFENADDHRYLQTVADHYGIIYSRCGNGICHQVHLERFARPGKTLLGSDSHTPTAGGIGSLAIGAGGLDVACAMAGLPFSLNMPEIIGVKLIGRLKKGVSAKDIILRVLQLLSVKGGVGKVVEYFGEGVKSLSVPERSTITNMGAELGATTSIFPSDERTKEFLEKQGRGADYQPLSSDDEDYQQIITVDLNGLEPLVACPHSPDNVQTVASLKGLKVNQVAIGSCTNSSFTDLVNVARILKDKKVHPDVSLCISFGSRQVLAMLQECGALYDLIASGARLLESTCGPCIGMGQSPCTDAVSLRTFNRNFYGRSGTLSAGVYLVSPETAAASAISGYLCSAEDCDYEQSCIPEHYLIDDSMLLKPTFKAKITYGPNIKPFPLNKAMMPRIEKQVVIKTGDNITTDHIMPAGAKILPYRSNIEKISEFCFSTIDDDFAKRCQRENGGIIVAGENYGQGSSREHAALAPMYLGIKAVIAKSYARIHRQNLINSGIIPFVFASAADYDRLEQGDELIFDKLDEMQVASEFALFNKTRGISILLKHDLTERELELLRNGGLLNTLSKALN